MLIITGMAPKARRRSVKKRQAAPPPRLEDEHNGHCGDDAPPDVTAQEPQAASKIEEDAPPQQTPCQVGCNHAAEPQPPQNAPQISQQQQLSPQPTMDEEQVKSNGPSQPPASASKDPVTCALDLMKQYGVTDMDRARFALDTVEPKAMTTEE